MNPVSLLPHLVVLPFHDHGTRRGTVVSVTTLSLYIPVKETLPIVQEVGCAPGPVWTSAENLAPHQNSIPRPSSP